MVNHHDLTISGLGILEAAILPSNRREEARLIWILPKFRLVDLDAQSRFVADCEVAVFESRDAREQLFDFRRIFGELLDAKIGNRQVEVDGRGEGKRSQIVRSLKGRLYLERLGENGNFPQFGQAPALAQGIADVVDELVG